MWNEYKGKCFKIDFRKDVLDSTLYNREHGEGKLESIVRGYKKQKSNGESS